MGGRGTAIAVDEVSRAIHESPLQEPPSDEGGGLPKARRRERFGWSHFRQVTFGRAFSGVTFWEGTEALPYDEVLMLVVGNGFIRSAKHVTARINPCPT